MAAVIRGFASRGVERLGELLAGPGPDAALRPAAALLRRRPDPRLAGRDPEPRAARRRWTTLTGGEQTLALGPGRLTGRDQASSGPTAAASSTSTRPSRSRTRPPFRSSSRWFILLIPAALTATFGRMVGNRRQGWALFAAMAIMLVGTIAVGYAAEQNGSPAQKAAGLEMASSDGTTGGNLEGKEQRNGILAGRRGAAATTAASNGSVDSAHESFTGIGGTVPLVNMMTGEVIFGGVGSGLYGMLLFAILTVFIAGLMVGRTPEYLGKKIDARDVKLVVIGTIAVPLLVLVTARVGHLDRLRRTLDLQQEQPSGVLRSALRLHLAVEQQRLGLRRLHRLRAAKRPRQRGRLRDHVRRRPRRDLDADRALRAAAGGLWRSPDHWRRSASRRSAPAPSAPTRRPSSSC